MKPHFMFVRELCYVYVCVSYPDYEDPFDEGEAKA